MDVSVVMPTFNGGRWIGDQLEALSTQTYGDEWELMIADNGSTDDTRSIARSWTHRFPHLRLVDTSDVRGQSHARNQGARAATGDVLLFTDQDDIVPPNWISLLTKGLSQARIVSGPVSHFVDGEPPVRDPRRTHGHASDGSLVHLFGCNMGIHRDLFLELGGFDETATRGWEDMDLGIRALLHGVSITYLDSAVVLHRRPRSIRLTWRKEYRYARGWTALERRYPEIAKRNWVRRSLRGAGWIALRAPFVALPKRRRILVARAASIAGGLAERLKPCD